MSEFFVLWIVGQCWLEIRIRIRMIIFIFIQNNIRIRPNSWTRIEFVFVFGPKNTIGSPLLPDGKPESVEPAVVGMVPQSLFYFVPQENLTAKQDWLIFYNKFYNFSTIFPNKMYTFLHITEIFFMDNWTLKKGGWIFKILINFSEPRRALNQTTLTLREKQHLKCKSQIR